MRSQEFTGRTTQEAIDAGLAALGVTIADVHVDGIQEGAKGLFGLFGSKPACVRLTVMDDEKEDDHGLSDLLSSFSLNDQQPRKKQAPKAEKKPEVKAEAKAEVKAEEPVKEPAKEEKQPETVAEPGKEEPKAETKAEEKALENKSEASENVKNAGSIEVVEIKGKPSKPAQERQPVQNRDNRDNRESRPRDDRGGRNDRPARPERNDRGDRPGFDKNRNNGGQGGQRPQRDNRRQGGLSIPAVDPAVMQQDTRREKVQAPEKQHKKEQTRQQGGRNNNAPQKDKYKTAQRFIGDKKGVNEIESDEFSYSGAYDIDHSRKKSAKPKKKDKNAKAQPGNPPVIAVLTNIKVPPVLTVKELAEMMKKSASEVIKKLMLMGVMATLNQELDFDTAALIASEFGITAEPEIIVTDEELLFEDPDDEIEAEDAEPDLLL